ncbi:DNA repair protein RadC [Bergeyella porcorum]|uniref:RadC family protein n=1 Tax=Bergeyella porcorum TaxID=1735111 RepID=UPI0035F0EB14
MSIKFLAEDDRPREKFILKGKNTLSDAELLAIIIGSGNRDESAVELSRRILQSVGNNWHQLSRLSIKDLMKFNGVGEAKAIAIAAALEIGRRRASQEVAEKKSLTSPNEAFWFFKPYLSDLQTEEVWAAFVNQKNKILHFSQISSGGISSSVVDVRVLFKTALDHFATGIFLAHNHPAGSLQPSEEDIKITKQIHQAGKLLNITLIDHLILNQTSFFSFSNEGLL